jgi:hypothetical protein
MIDCSKDEFEKFIDILGEGSGRALKQWCEQYETFKDKKLDYLFMGGFHRFVDKNPSAVWTAVYIQRQFAKYNLGQGYWDRKLEQFRLIRLENEIQMNI